MALDGSFCGIQMESGQILLIIVHNVEFLHCGLIKLKVDTTMP